MSAPQEPSRQELADAIVSSESFAWLFCGDPEWRQAHIDALRPTYAAWLAAS